MVRERRVDVVVVGAGPAGVAAAWAARNAGAESVLVLERDEDLGGILQQCIHPGFGVASFGEELTGPEFMARWISRAREAGVIFAPGTLVTALEADGMVETLSVREGVQTVTAGAVVLASGCRERPLGALGVPGTRPAGVFSAGTAQRLVNMEGFLPGRRVVVLGSGDIGLIMARRMIWEGATVEGVYEALPWPGGLRRNLAQCLDDYGVPLYLEHTITRLYGVQRLEGVTVARVDRQKRPLAGTERFVPCDTLLVAVGLIQETELARGAGLALDSVTGGLRVDQEGRTSAEGIFAAGNTVLVYDLADAAAEAGVRAGGAAARRVRGLENRNPSLRRRFDVVPGKGVRLVAPGWWDIAPGGRGRAVIHLRVDRVWEEPCRVTTSPGGPSRTLPYARPGEMVELALDGAILEALPPDAHTLTVTVEPLKERGQG